MQWLKKLFAKKQDVFNSEGIIVKSAFTVGGIEYLECSDIYKLPYERGVAAVRVYEEMRMKCDYDFLKAHVTAIDNLFKGKKIGFEEISKIKQLNQDLKDRLYYIVDTDIIYKLASVVFFDKTESPLEYDFNYARKKIEHWKKHSTVQDFFLQEPMVRLIPFLKQPEVNFQSCSDAIMEFNKIQWDNLLPLLSETQRKTFSVIRDFYVKETSPESVN